LDEVFENDGSHLGTTGSHLNTSMY